MDIVYYSNVSNNTARFVAKLSPEHTAWRLPLRRSEPMIQMAAPFVLITPTYGAGNDGHAVPGPVIRFLNDPHNRHHLRGVIASGNTNFGRTFCLAGEIIAEKLQVPLLHKFEILGTPEDVTRVDYLLTQQELGSYR
jgi:protein involved in ribonucleotide reduction